MRPRGCPPSRRTKSYLFVRQRFRGRLVEARVVLQTTVSARSWEASSLGLTVRTLQHPHNKRTSLCRIQHDGKTTRTNDTKSRARPYGSTLDDALSYHLIASEPGSSLCAAVEIRDIARRHVHTQRGRVNVLSWTRTTTEMIVTLRNSRHEWSGTRHIQVVARL